MYGDDWWNAKFVYIRISGARATNHVSDVPRYGRLCTPSHFQSGARRGEMVGVPPERSRPAAPSIAAQRYRGGNHGESIMPWFVSVSPCSHSENCPGTVLFFLGSRE